MDKEIRITRKQFREAMAKVTENMVEDDELEGIAKLVVPMTGMMFAKKVEEKLFDDNSETNEESIDLMDIPVSTDCADEEKI